MVAVFVAAFTVASVVARPAVARAASVYVAVTGSDTTGSGSFGSPYATVQKAVNMAVSGDVVSVGSGTFNGDITMKDGVSLQGAGAAETTLKGSGGPVITASGIGGGTSISGFTITGGSGFVAGGIYCDSSSPDITGDTITGNSANVGAGIYCTGLSSPDITDDTITGNSAFVGAGIYCTSDSSPSITSDTISSNSAAGAGGGICCWSSSATIANDIISGNSATVAGGRGGGIYCGSSSPSITNDTITGNSATVSGGGIYCTSDSSPNITNCIVWDNGEDLSGCSATYSDIENVSVASGLGNIIAAPSFANTATGDFRLMIGSPCIDAATSTAAPAADKDGIPRPQGRGYDMGAYEYPVVETLSYTAGASGSIVGSSTQVVNYGASGTTVTATPNTGYHFVSWSDTSSTDPVRQDTNVTGNVTASASFAINTYTLTYTAGSGGTISGTSPQTVNYDGSGTAVTAVANAGHHFASWSDGVTTAARTDSAVRSDLTATAVFAVDSPDTRTLIYAAGLGGTISGTSPQTVVLGASGTAVTAVPSSGYHFVRWNDGITTATRTDGNVTTDKSVTAEFALDAVETRTLTYLAGTGGTISGTSPQTVALGGSGTAVTAAPNSGYHFVSWSDGATTATRADLVVLSDLTVTATFARNPLPKATVYTPHAPSTMYRNHHYTIYGYVAPRHTSGTYLVTLKFYLRNSHGVYVYHHSVKARRYYYSTTKTKYKATVSLPHKGRWRVRAYHSDSGHAPSYSGYDYITVK
jgi:predicted outer membrane repeat protein